MSSEHFLVKDIERGSIKIVLLLLFIIIFVVVVVVLFVVIIPDYV